MRSEALYLNGVFEQVLRDIINAQAAAPELVLFLQPHGQAAITQLRDDPPTPDDPMCVFISVSTDLERIRYVGDCVGWDDKTKLSGARRDTLEYVSRTFQPSEGGLFDGPEGPNHRSLNLLHIRGLQVLQEPFSVTELRKTKDDTPLRARAQPGGYSYVYNSFQQSEVFPIVARLILRAAADGVDLMGHGAIVESLLVDPEARRLVERVSTSSALPDRRAVASNMVAWFSQKITIGESLWGDFFDREQRDGAWAYRPRSATTPQSSDPDLFAVEGEPRLLFHLRRERDPALARAKRSVALAAGNLRCEACGFATESSFPGLGGDVCEVHHRAPLASTGGPVQTRLEDLALLCANCHRAIHRTRPLHSVEEFRRRFFEP